MTIEELGDVLGVDLVIKRRPDQGRRYTAAFFRVEVKENSSSSILAGEYGTGRTPNEAINDYIDKIRGKLLVFNALSSNRKEISVPQTLEQIKENMP